ncbi:ubiquitin carboxyl-terminal hydrolase domain-containing protein [Ditylenchus destructor]|nr:ubiquitin carboxyl-terminal hydrolase domain-containing protein [Ditylenchus destructor]
MTIHEKPLRFESFNILRENARMDDISFTQVKRRAPRGCLDLLISIVEKAQKETKHEDPECAYILYGRAVDLIQLVHNKNDLEFRTSPDYQRYLDVADNVFREMDYLSDQLKLLYKLREKNKLKEAKSYESQPAMPSSSNNVNVENAYNRLVNEPSENCFDFDAYIKPQQLIHCIEEKKASVLVLDYREEKEKVIEYNQVPNSISVAHIDPSLIVPGCVWSMLVSVVDISNRPLLQRIAYFDLVVLMGDTVEMKTPLANLPQSSRTKVLLEALTTYKMRERPKRKPLMLERGFNGWDMAYPCYTKPTESYRCEQSLDTAFGSLLADALKVTQLDISYPDLSNRVQSLFQSKKQENTTSEDTIVENSVDPTRNAVFSSVERPKKPKENVPVFNVAIPSESATVSLPFMPNRPCGTIYPTDAIRKALPQVQTLGGARISVETSSDASANKSNHPSQVVQPPKPMVVPTSAPRPPIPDRSTKASMINTINKEKEYFHQVYKASWMKIQESSTHGNAPPGYTGLYNLGNTCFMNATLQALFNTPGFSQLFRNKRVESYINRLNKKYGTMGVISACFASLMDAVWQGGFIAIKPLVFLETFAYRVNASLADRRQHDAQEFQIYLLDALHEDCNKIIQRTPFEQNYNGRNLPKEAEEYAKRTKEFSYSIVNEFFNLRTVSLISCTVCSSASVTFEDMNQISVELPSAATQSQTTLKECMQRHFSDVVLEGQSCWKCPKCRGPRVANRSIKIWQLPSILIVHMKRFSLEGGDYVKNEIDVSFDISDLDMSAYIHDKAPKQISRYALYAVTNHDGRLNSGHYTSNVKNVQNDQWLKLDDEQCSALNPSDIVSKKAFILYYANGAKSGGSNNT